MEYNVEKKCFELHGEIFATMRHADGSVETRNYKNIIVDVASEQMAEWAIAQNSVEFPRVDGIRVLAVGTGAVGWDLQNPPPATAAQTQLENELQRNTFESVNYVTPGTFVPSLTRTNIVDYITTYTETQAVGPLVEMGLFGGTGATSPSSGTMINYKTFPVWNKSSTSTLTIVWRLTF